MGQEGKGPVRAFAATVVTYVIARREWPLGVNTGVDSFRRHTRCRNGSLVLLLDEIDADPSYIFWGRGRSQSQFTMS